MTTEYTFYIIVCNDPNITDCYVGSTKVFRQRKYEHKSRCNNELSEKHHFKIYQTIRANGGWNNWSVKPIDTKICNNLEARIHEMKLIEERNAKLNCKNAYTDNEKYQKKYREDNKDKKREYDKAYRLKQKEKKNGLLNQYTLEVPPNHLL